MITDTEISALSAWIHLIITWLSHDLYEKVSCYIFHIFNVVVSIYYESDFSHQNLIHHYNILL
jgi:hypothetical protein